MSVQATLAEGIAQDARLEILRQLEKQVDGRLSATLLRRALDIYGITRDRDWIETQLRKLEALGAIEILSIGDMLVAKIQRPGLDHLQERSLLVGVTRPRDDS